MLWLSEEHNYDWHCHVLYSLMYMARAIQDPALHTWRLQSAQRHVLPDLGARYQAIRLLLSSVLDSQQLCQQPMSPCASRRCPSSCCTNSSGFTSRGCIHTEPGHFVARTRVGGLRITYAHRTAVEARHTAVGALWALSQPYVARGRRAPPTAVAAPWVIQVARPCNELLILASQIAIHSSFLSRLSSNCADNFAASSALVCLLWSSVPKVVLTPALQALLFPG